MNLRIPGAVAAILLFSVLDRSTLAHELFCAGEARLAAPVDSSEHRKYAPERAVDILHLIIDVTPDFRERSVTGKTTVRFKPLLRPVRELRLNAQDLRVSDLDSSIQIEAWENTGSELVVHFATELPAGIEQEISVAYKAYPRKGLYFRTTEMGYLPEDEHLFTQGEDIEARHWFPCYDAPNEKFTSEVICRVPEEMTVLSNGKLISEVSVGQDMKAVHWRQHKPHVSYLICLVAGHFRKIEDQYKDIHLAFYTPSSQIDLAPNSFRETKEMMEFFENEIGYPYPWEKYYQVCIQDFMWGGMENTSLTTLNDRTLFPDETENIRSSQGLVAHELAHQWFGDLVTCRDWSHIWLNEGFATYYAHLFNLHKDGRDDFLYGMYNSARGFINRSVAEDSRPVVFRKYDQPTELFGYLVYPKGAWVLHMLRSELGPELFRKCIRTYLERHQFDTVVTHDLITVIEQVTGRAWDQFFDQWIFHPHHPELRVTYSWDEKSKLAKIGVAQVQQLTNEVGLFKVPLKIRLKGSFGAVDKTLQIQNKQEDFFIPLGGVPEIVRVDPDYELLAKITFEPPRNLLVKQLHDETDLIGRIFALEQLAKSKDNETVALISDRLNSDPFYGVRMEAAQALRSIRTKEALEALISSRQDDARVRQKIAMEVGNFFDPAALEYAVQILANEKNPEIKHHGLRALGAYPGDEQLDILKTSLTEKSFRNTVADGAIVAIRGQARPDFIEPLIDALIAGTNSFTAQGFGRALETLAQLARSCDNKDNVYEFILRHVSNPRKTIQVAAIRALGTLGDERAMPVLSGFNTGPSDAPETPAAKAALEKVRSGRSSGNEMQTLRSEVLDLKKQNEELKKSLDELKKRIEATFSSTAINAESHSKSE